MIQETIHLLDFFVSLLFKLIVFTGLAIGICFLVLGKEQTTEVLQYAIQWGKQKVQHDSNVTKGTASRGDQSMVDESTSKGGTSWFGWILRLFFVGFLLVVVLFGLTLFYIRKSRKRREKEDVDMLQAINVIPIPPNRKEEDFKGSLMRIFRLTTEEGKVYRFSSDEWDHIQSSLEQSLGKESKLMEWISRNRFDNRVDAIHSQLRRGVKKAIKEGKSESTIEDLVIRWEDEIRKELDLLPEKKTEYAQIIEDTLKRVDREKKVEVATKGYDLVRWFYTHRDYQRPENKEVVDDLTNAFDGMKIK